MLSLLLGTTSFSVQVNEDVLHAISYVESGQDSKAIGDNGQAVGSFQIHRIYVREANRILKAYVFDYSLRSDPEASEEMARVVLTYWGNYFEKKGYRIGPAELCSIHRHPNSRWSPKYMESDLEKGRTKKLKAYLNKG